METLTRAGGIPISQAGGLPAIKNQLIEVNKAEKPVGYTGEEWHQKRNFRSKSDAVRMFAAAQVSRLTADWPISISSANAEILVSAIATRSRLRQLERDDDYMRRMLRLFQNNIIGHQGIMLQMKIKD